MKKITFGQINDVMIAAQKLEPLEKTGQVQAFRQNVADMEPDKIIRLIQAVNMIRRVAREWELVEVPLEGLVQG